MYFQKYKKIFLYNLVLFSFLIPFWGDAQPITLVDDDIQITAHVAGCGDGIRQSDLGEQCEGLDLNNQTCRTLNFRSGDLSCRSSCIFDTSSCVPNTRNRRKDVSGIFSSIQTTLVFSGSTKPQSWVIVTADGDYFTSVQSDAEGNFIASVAEPPLGSIDFIFYAVSDVDGISQPVFFTTNIQQDLTTRIINIIIPFPRDLDGDVLTTDIVEGNINDRLLNVETVSTQDSFNKDVAITFLGDISGDESISTQELQNIINTVSGGLNTSIDFPVKNTWIDTSQEWLFEKTNGYSEWYPNTYISFMVPYWNLSYDAIDWFKREQAPWFRSWF